MLGPRQVGKSSLIQHLGYGGSLMQLDDLQLRSRARQDPALAFLDRPYPILVDEFQYAPELLSEIKLRIDRYRQSSIQGGPESRLPLFFLSGSNQIEVDRALRETLAGRISLFRLHGLSVNELCSFSREISIRGLSRNYHPNPSSTVMELGCASVQPGSLGSHCARYCVMRRSG